MNVIVVLCRSSVASDPPICSDGHVPDAGCYAGDWCRLDSTTAMMCWTAGGHHSLPAAPTTVGVKCDGTAGLSSEML